MAASTYPHQVICWIGKRQQLAQYELRVMAIGQHGEPIHRAQWTFETLTGLVSFHRKHFPTCRLVQQL